MPRRHSDSFDKPLTPAGEACMAFGAALKAIRETRYYDPFDLTSETPVVLAEEHDAHPHSHRLARLAQPFIRAAFHSAYGDFEKGRALPSDFDALTAWLRIDVNAGAGKELAALHAQARELTDREAKARKSQRVANAVAPVARDMRLITKTQAALFRNFLDRFHLHPTNIAQIIHYASPSVFQSYAKPGGVTQESYAVMLQKLGAAFGFNGESEKDFEQYVELLPPPKRTRSLASISEKTTLSQQLAVTEYLQLCGVKPLPISREFGKAHFYFDKICTGSPTLNNYHEALALLGFADDAALQARVQELREDTDARGAEKKRLLARALECRSYGGIVPGKS